MNRKVMIWALILCGAGSSGMAQAPSSSFVPGTPADEADIRSIVASQSADKEDYRIATDLDWENAFGIRYTNLEKRNHFFNTYIKSQFKDATNTSLEVKLRFLDSTIAVADEYWHVAGQVYAGEAKPGPDRWGRTTYIFKKEGGTWTEVMERVADLRSPYFKHYDALPTPAHVDAATLRSYAGNYAAGQGKPSFEVAVSGDRLTITGNRDTFVGIPTSSGDFLGFDPKDLAEYYLVSFRPNPTSVRATSTSTMTLRRADGQLLMTLSKAQ
jgi:hypothetical protein